MCELKKYLKEVRVFLGKSDAWLIKSEEIEQSL